jgi:hypothetical protein
MTIDLAGRIRARLDALDLNPFAAAKAAGLERSFVNDVLIGRKRSVREDGLRKLAGALECDAEYLTGHQDTPRAGAADHAQGMPLIGVAETGVWRTTPAGAVEARVVPLLPDPRFPGIACYAVTARGDGGSLVGIDDGDIVVALDFAAWRERHGPLRDGLVVLVRRTRADLGVSELSVRRVSISVDAVTLDCCSHAAYPSFPLEGSAGERVEIVGLVDKAVRLFM